MKKVIFAISILTLGIVGTIGVFASTYSWEETVTLSTNDSITSPAAGIVLSNIAAQSNVSDKSVVSKNASGYYQVKYTASKKGILGIYSTIGTQTVNIYSPGWVGGIWKGVSKGTYKFKYKMTSGAVKQLDVRAYEY